MQYSRKQNILLTMKICLLVCGCVFFGKMSRTLKSIPWVAKLNWECADCRGCEFHDG